MSIEFPREAVSKPSAPQLSQSDEQKVHYASLMKDSVKLEGIEDSEIKAAVDVALCDKDGNDFDFGTKYHDNHRNRDLTKEQKENRKTLLKLMRTQNFIKNPGQWWHFSYGDKNWSAYKGKRSGAFYDSAEKEFENMGFVRVVKTVIKSVSVK